MPYKRPRSKSLQISQIYDYARRGPLANYRSRHNVAYNLARGIASTAGNMAVRAMPAPVATAARVAGAAYRAYKSYKSRGTGTGPRTRSEGLSPYRRYRTQGKYRGPFKSKRKVRRDIYREYGFVHTTEVHGTVSDPDCVYVGHSTYSSLQLLEVMCQSLLKKLFSKAGIHIQNITEPIKGFESNTSNCWRIRLQTKNAATGALTNVDYDTPAGVDTSIYQIVGDQSAGIAPLWTPLLTTFANYMTGGHGATFADGNSDEVIEPFQIILYRQEGNTATFWQFQSQIIFTEETILMKSKSDLKIQNRSLAADASSDAEDVSNNPIQGYLYKFNGGCPRAKMSGMDLVDALMEPSGVLHARAAQLNAGFKEPPRGNFWWNCMKADRVLLNPGDIKKDTIYHQTKMPFLKFLKACGYGQSASPGNANRKSINLFGKSSLVSFEDVINVNPTQNVAIAYEVNREFGCFLVTKKRNVSMGIRYDITSNNDAP